MTETWGRRGRRRRRRCRKTARRTITGGGGEEDVRVGFVVLVVEDSTEEGATGEVALP